MDYGALLRGVWAIEPAGLAELVALLDLHVAGRTLALGAASREREAPRIRSGRRDVAVVPIYGPMLHRGGFLAELLGLTTTMQVTALVQHHAADASIGGIVLDIDSPGGMVAGVPELAAAIAAASQRKPVIAAINTVAASAAYWAASQASEIVVAPSGEVGSIGVLATHVSEKAALDRAGLTVSYISSAPFKVELSPAVELSSAARAHLQERVDRVHRQFAGDVARGRQVTPARVDSAYGQGRTVLAADAVAAGMADRIGTLADVVRHLAAGETGVLRAQLARLAGPTRPSQPHVAAARRRLARA